MTLPIASVPLALPRALRPRPTAWLVACLCATGFAGTPALAQESGPGLEPVVITGSTREQKLVDAPYAVNAVGAQAIRSAGPMINLSEALGSVPGLVVANRSNYAQDLQISSRGFGARAGFGVRGLRLYTDGIPATMPDGQGQVAHFDLAGADRVEVLRGPFSSLYGNSSGGVIALYSAPITRRTVEAGVDFGSFGLRQQRVSFGTPLDGGFSIGANLTNMDIDGFRPHSDADRRLANLRLGWKGEADRVTVSFSDHHQQANDPLGLTRAAFDADPDQTASAATTYNTRKTIDQTQLGGSWQHRVGGEGPLQSTQLSAYAGQRSVFQMQSTPRANQLIVGPTPQQSYPTSAGGVVDFDRRYHGIDGRLDWLLGETELITGVNLENQRDNRKGYENFTSATTLGVVGNLRRDEINRASTREAYLQVNQPLAERWQLAAGVRSGKVELSNQDFYVNPAANPTNPDDSGAMSFRYTSPVLGLRFQVDPGLTLHASASRGYESPTLGEVAYRSDGLSGFNTALKAQTSRQFELGAKWRQGAVGVDVAAFQISTRNEIGVLSSANGRSSFQNVGRTSRKGLELATRWQIAPVWRTQLALTALDATYGDSFVTCTGTPCTPATSATNTAIVASGKRIAGTQRASAFGELAWTPFWSPAAEAAVEWRAAGSTVANDLNTGVAGGYGIASVRYRHDFAMGENAKVELLARLDNLADRRYAGSVIVNDANGRYYEPAPGRNALVSLRYRRGF